LAAFFGAAAFTAACGCCASLLPCHMRERGGEGMHKKRYF
jgi:hypothetical protein